MLNWRFFLRWTCLGLLLRFLIMPFTLHSIDLFSIQYTPFLIIRQHQIDVYQYFHSRFPDYPFFLYPPATLYLTLIFQKIFLPLLPSLTSLMETFERVAFLQRGGTVHLASALQDPYLFRTLFLFKVPYLIYDFSIAAVLLTLAEGAKQKIWAYRLWMLNPFSLHTSYAIGQIDMMVAFFLLISLFMFQKGWLRAGMVMLGVGGLVKLAPFYLIPGIAFLFGKGIRGKLTLLICGILPLVGVLSFSPDAKAMLQSWGAYADYFWRASPSVAGGSKLLILFLIIGYGGTILFFFSQQENKTKSLLSVYSILLLILLLTVSPKIRFLLWVAPFLILEFLRQPRMMPWGLILLFNILGIYGAGINLRLGLFAPVDPTFFCSLPILDSFFSALIDIRWTQRLCLYGSYLSVIVILYLIFRQHVLRRNQ